MTHAVSASAASATKPTEMQLPQPRERWAATHEEVGDCPFMALGKEGGGQRKHPQGIGAAFCGAAALWGRGGLQDGAVCISQSARGFFHAQYGST